jgi:hypothetical protein
MKKIKIITVILFSIGLLSCESSTYEEISGVVENPTYTKNIKPIFDSKCVTCHYTGNSEGLSSFTNYTETKQGVQSGSVLYYIDTLGTMPKNSSKLPNQTIQLIYKWKQNGYPEN